MAVRYGRRMTIQVVFETHSTSEDTEKGVASGWAHSRLELRDCAWNQYGRLSAGAGCERDSEDLGFRRHALRAG